MPVLCELCKVQVSSDVAMQEHVKGQRHKQLESAAEGERLRTERSVYVRGFEAGVTTCKLHEHFGAFGRVQNVYLDKEKGTYAIVEYATKDAAAYLLSKAPIYLGKRRLTVKPKAAKARKTMKCELEANMKQPSVKELEGAGAKTEREAKHTALMSRLITCKDISEQMLLLTKDLQLTEQDVGERLVIQQTLQSILRALIPGCEVHLFGSSVNGYGVKGCDLDLLVDLKLEESERPTQKEAGSKDDTSHCNNSACFANMPGIKVDPETGAICKQSLMEACLLDRVKLVAQILCNDGGPFKETFTITKARVPVIKTVHSPTGLRCDLSINNGLALRNTLLIQHYTSLDPRVRPLICTLRYWFKTRQLCGSKRQTVENVNSGPRLTSYAVMMLGFFYLQTLEKPLLPTVHHLADMAETSQETLDGWDCNFSTEKTETHNTSSLQELLEGFFQYYSNLDITSQVICPRTGQTVDLDHFREEMACDERLSLFKVSPICIQDPFVLNHNIASNVNQEKKSQLISRLSQAVSVVADSSFSCPLGKNWGLALLCTDKPPLEANPLAPHFASPDATSFEYSFPVIMKAAHFAHKLFHMVPAGENSGRVQQDLDSSNVRERWCSLMVSFISRTVLGNILYFAVEEIPKGTRQRVESNVPQTTDKQLEDIALDCNKRVTKRASSTVEGMNNSKRSRSDSESSPTPAIGDRNRAVESMSVDSAGTVETSTQGKNSSIKEYSQAKMLVSLAGQSSPRSPQSCTTLHKFAMGVSGSPSGETQTPNPVKLLTFFRCSTNYRMWIGRKQIRKDVKHDNPEADGITVEAKVSQLIAEMQKPMSSPILEFELFIFNDSSKSQSSLVVCLSPTRGQREFPNFFPFLGSFVNKLADKKRIK